MIVLSKQFRQLMCRPEALTELDFKRQKIKGYHMRITASLQRTEVEWRKQMRWLSCSGYSSFG